MFDSLPTWSVALIVVVCLPLLASALLAGVHQLFAHSHLEIGPPVSLPHKSVAASRWNVRGLAGRVVEVTPREDPTLPEVPHWGDSRPSASGTWTIASASVSVSGVWPVAE